MATITLHYNTRNKNAKRMIDLVVSSGLVTVKKSGLEEALEDVAKGRVTTVHIPKNKKTE